MASMNQWEKLQLKIEKDIIEQGVSRGEFVVSAMTKAVENSIRHYFDDNTAEDLPALDIGTGTAYHTALLLALGQSRVISVDINPTAISYAKERLAKFFPSIKQFEESNFADFLEASIGEDQAVNLYNYALEKVMGMEQYYSLVSFNPPILYPLLDPQFGKPATHGVYVENRDVKRKENDLVYQLYDNIARKNLKKGSHILCIWANLNRHLVELDPFTDQSKDFVHPARILENWFDFEFINEAESFDSFYCHKTILGAGFFNQSETGKLYTDNLRTGIEQDYYSDLLIASEEENLSGTYFHFGVLHLEKTDDHKNQFKIINGSSKGKEG